jgi:hypothetical protein
MSNNTYFAADKPENTVAYLESKAKEWFTGITDTSYLEKIKASWRSYYGDYYGRHGSSSHSITFGGENGELVNLAVNHYRNLAQHILVMVTGTRPAFQCRATNTDRKSLIQAKLGNGLLDYYMREMRLEEVLKDAVEYAIVLGSGYIKLEWNSTQGEIIDYIEPDPSSIVDQDEDGNPIDENGQIVESFPIREGEVEASLMSPFDVVFDSTKPYFDKNEWVVCRTPVNKHNIIRKYPELARKIQAIDSVASEQKKYNSVPYTKYDETNDIHIYELFHKRTEAVPNGRYILYINKDIILEDTILPYRKLPVYRIVPSSIIGTPYGYSNMFDLLPIQDMVNSLYSTAATNINAFGVQSILSPRGADVEAEQVGDGMQFIEYNAEMGKPEPLQLTATSPEVYQMMQLLERTMETLSGVNSVARGNPEQSLRSGNALALVQSQALQYVSGLQKSYIRLLEDVGTGLIHLLQDFASSPRMIAIAGMNNSTEMKEFKAEDIRSISRVAVDVGNALMQTSAGRAQVAENLMQMGLIDNVDKYLMVLNTGNLDYLTDGKMDNLTLIKAENESMILGKRQQAIWSEKHSMHIKEHMEVLNDPKLKEDPELVQRVLDHVQQHANLLRSVDPALLQVIGEQPLPPAPNPANMGQQVPGGAPAPAPAAGGQGVPVDQSTGAAMAPQQAVDPNLPQPAQPAGVQEGILPPQPTSPEDLL